MAEGWPAPPPVFRRGSGPAVWCLVLAEPCSGRLLALYFVQGPEVEDAVDVGCLGGAGVYPVLEDPPTLKLLFAIIIVADGRLEGADFLKGTTLE